MKILEKISDLFGKYLAIIVLAVAALSLFLPKSALWIQTSWVNYLLMVIMFGMGLTMKPKDFTIVFTKPKEIIIGCAAQFIIMPALAFVLSRVFNLDAALTAGVVLVGTCPGGTASNVITYFSKGDVALSVGMTSVNTLLAPVLTPAITFLLLRTAVSVDIVSMFLTIIEVIIVPIGLGFVINKFFGKFTAKASKFLTVVSTIAICMIISSVVAHNSEKILTTGAIVFVVVILHNLLGYGCGFGLGKLLKLPPSKTKALSIEIGMQNSGLATSLAGSAFPSLAMATVPGAIFSVWHNISGAILAGIYRRWNSI
ncbi:MAG: bile acid:sodium symporter family protein [Clostridia bacterium]|nr:bile acid:sodium symporter family protein [Clostridia bacterium]MBQ3463315.1 bile acid:sodium symporter family protein [Clostridia bacterium]MBQ7572748.1 bile acid:sodium symporter family protein [Clostridia bacterium]MBR0470155.1 bile acid:sodium symporter family protein [Clostridia bacterium]